MAREERSRSPRRRTARVRIRRKLLGATAPLLLIFIVVLATASSFVVLPPW